MVLWGTQIVHMLTSTGEAVSRLACATAPHPCTAPLTASRSSRRAHGRGLARQAVQVGTTDDLCEETHVKRPAHRTGRAARDLRCAQAARAGLRLPCVSPPQASRRCARGACSRCAGSCRGCPPRRGWSCRCATHSSTSISRCVSGLGSSAAAGSASSPRARIAAFISRATRRCACKRATSSSGTTGLTR